MKKFVMNKIVFRYFIFYFFIYVITAVGLSAMSFFYIMPRYAAEEEKNALKKLEYVSENIDEKIQEIETLTRKIGANTELRKNLFSDNIGDIFEGENIIEGYADNYDFISDIIIHYDEKSELFFSSNGKVSVENLCRFEKQYNVCREYIKNNNDKYEQKGKIVLYTPENSSNSVLMIVCRSRVMVPYSMGLDVIYTVNDMKFTNIINALYENANEGLSVFSEDGEHYTTVGEKYDIKKEELQKISDNVKSTKIKGERVVIIKSGYSGLRYVYHAPESEIFDGYMEIQIVFVFIFLFLYFCFCLLLCLFCRCFFL